MGLKLSCKLPSLLGGHKCHRIRQKCRETITRTTLQQQHCSAGIVEHSYQWLRLSNNSINCYVVIFKKGDRLRNNVLIFINDLYRNTVIRTALQHQMWSDATVLRLAVLMDSAYICKTRRCSSGCRCLCRCSIGRRSSVPGCCTPDAGTGGSRRCKTTTKPRKTTFRRRPGRSGCRTSSGRAGLRIPVLRWPERAGRRFEPVSGPHDRIWCYIRTTQPRCSTFPELEWNLFFN